MEQKKTIDGFDLLKIISATLIVFHHYQQSFQVRFDFINFFGGRIYFGNLVELFFMISGFLTALPPRLSDCPKNILGNDSYSGSWLQWWRRKLLRIYPMVSIACLFALIVNSIKVEYLMATDILGKFKNVPENVSALDILWSWKTLIANFGLLFSGWPYFSMMGINNPTWYCCVLIQCYICFFVIGKVTSEKFTKMIAFTVLIIADVLLYRLDFFQSSTFRGLEAFFIGCCLCELYKVHNVYKVHKLSPLLLLTNKVKNLCYSLILLSCIMLCLIPSQQRRIFLLGVFPPVVLLATQKRLYKSNRLNHVIHELSKVSFEVFIWHAPLMGFEKMIIRVINSVNSEVLGVHFERTYGSMMLFSMCIWLFSWMMYKYVEIPINRLLRNKEGERA